jgi:hypothetical protein
LERCNQLPESSLPAWGKVLVARVFFAFFVACTLLLPDAQAEVEATILVVSLEGQVSSLSLEDDFKVELDSTAIGRKVDGKSILLTGKDGSVGLLFSNGTLITVKPGTRFYLREYAQKTFSPTGLSVPSKLKEEPSQSQLLAHLDFGELVVKVPRLKKGSNMILSSPLGTAGIRGTMFQLLAVRNPITGDITGGVNLISGDISFTDLEGREQSLVSGQSLHVASSRLGLPRAIQSGGLLDLNSIYHPVLLDGTIPPTVDQLFPGINPAADSGDDEFSTIRMPSLATGLRGEWEVVHKVASEIFFDIEQLEVLAEDFDFESMQYATSVSAPSPEIATIAPPASVIGGDFSLPEPVDGLYLNPPEIEIHPGADKVSLDGQVIEYLVQRKNLNYPVADHGPFKILPVLSGKYPSYSSRAFNGDDLTSLVDVSNANAVNYSILGQETQLTLYVDDLPIRKLAYPSGNPVSTTLTSTVRIVDNLPPLVLFSDGETQNTPYLVEGAHGGIFVDPGITVIDNYYDEQEIISHMGYANGLEESVFGTVDMGVADLYQITYQGISDPSGNVIDSKSRWVRVFDDEPPEITLYGSDPIYVDLNSSNVFKDPGAFASDNLDGAIEWESGRFEVVVEVLTDSQTQVYNQLTTTFEEVIALAKTQASVNATFRFKYSLKDKAGNQSDMFRQVVLLNSPFSTPTIVMHGDNPLYHEVNTVFVDPGVTAYKDMGTGVAPINLNAQVSSIAYFADSSIATVIDPSVVNYNKQTSKYVDSVGVEDPSTRVIIRYSVVDQFGNLASLDREVRIVDTTPPVITLNDAGGINFLNIQAGLPLIDPGAVASDNYDSSPVIAKSIKSIANGQLLSDPGGGEIFQTLELEGFWETGSFTILYESTDSNGNTGTKERNLVVQDTLPPDMVAITHQFLANPSIGMNSYQNSGRAIISASTPLPSGISNALGQLSGYDYSLSTFNRSTPYVNDFASIGDLYFKYSQVNQFDNTGTGQTTLEVQDAKGISYIWHSAFKAELQGLTVQDPGVYVINDSTTQVTVQSSINKTFDGGGNPYKFYISYTATQSSGETSQISNARVIRFLDEEAPVLELSPATDGVNTFVMAEAGVLYTDVATDVYPWQYGSKGTSEPLVTKAYDAIEEGLVTDKIDRTIFSGFVDSSSWGAGGTPVLRVDPITNTAKSLTEIGNLVSGLILTNLASLNQIYTIKYDVSDSAENAATPALRYVMVRDTLPPVVGLPPTQLVIIDSTSIANPDVRDEQSIKDYLVSDLTAQDATNNFDSNLTWNVTITKPNGQNTPPGGTGYDEPSPGAVSGIVFPVKQSDPGYIVSITASDSSGNVSTPVTRELKIGDTLPPTLTMMGKSIIHDFLRFSTNTTGTPPSPATHTDGFSGNEYNATGFDGGDHRMMLANYDFVDPGVYGEDENVNWSIDSGFPDWNGNGVGEGYEFVKVADRAQMDSCTYQGTPTYLKVHIYSTFNTTTLEQMQNDLYGGYGSGSAAKTPETNSSGYAFTDLNKESDPSKLRNLNVTSILIEYRVMDGWGNLSNIASRRVYVYESSQYDEYAFYATPINGLEGNSSGEMSAYYNNGSSTNYLTSFRKDTDGDGMSDYWEAIFETDHKLPDASHATPDWSLLNNISPSVIKNRVQNTLMDASQLDDMNSNWINGSHILMGL